jgi:hypothetical protein
MDYIKIHCICLPLVLISDGLFKVPFKLKLRSIVFTTAGTDILRFYIGQKAVPEFQGHSENNTFINVFLFLEKKKLEGSKSGKEGGDHSHVFDGKKLLHG